MITIEGGALKEEERDDQRENVLPSPEELQTDLNEVNLSKHAKYHIP